MRKPPFSVKIYLCASVIATAAIAMSLVPEAMRATADASPPPGCDPTNGDFASTAIVEDPAFPQADIARGTSGDLRIPGSGAVCQRITSIYIKQRQPGIGSVEFGVILGYSSCSGLFYSTPRAFYVSRSATNVRRCAVLTSAGEIDGDQYDDFRILNRDADGMFRPSWKGQQVHPGVQLGFNAGLSVGSTERGELGDGCTARWSDLEEWRPIEAWSDGDNLSRHPNSSEGPDCHFTRESGDTAKVTP